MHKVLWGLSIIMILATAGCGGGGGSTASTPLKLSNDIVGTWQVEDLGLPNDQIVIQDDGDVVVEATTSQTRGDSTVVIGGCSADGTLNLNGGWTVDGVDHTIDATGSVDSNNSKLSLCATVCQDEEVICENITVTGTKGDSVSDDDIEAPPDPPDMSDDDPYDTPPAPPSFYD
ncbi:hypothetical protein LLG46_14950 [bacterium]|nr:hypothetical protein [bacterium]